MPTAITNRKIRRPNGASPLMEAHADGNCVSHRFIKSLPAEAVSRLRRAAPAARFVGCPNRSAYQAVR